MAQLKVSLENIIPLTEARDHFSQIVTEVQRDKLYVLTKGGKPAVAIIDVKYLEAISGGSVNTSRIEQEIQKDPTKVGRTPMIKNNNDNFQPKSSLAMPDDFSDSASDEKTEAPITSSPINTPFKVKFEPSMPKPIEPSTPKPAESFKPTNNSDLDQPKPTTSIYQPTPNQNNNPTPTPINNLNPNSEIKPASILPTPPVMPPKENTPFSNRNSNPVKTYTLPTNPTPFTPVQNNNPTPPIMPPKENTQSFNPVSSPVKTYTSPVNPTPSTPIQNNNPSSLNMPPIDKPYSAPTPSTTQPFTPTPAPLAMPKIEPQSAPSAIPANNPGLNIPPPFSPTPTPAATPTPTPTPVSPSISISTPTPFSSVPPKPVSTPITMQNSPVNPPISAMVSPVNTPPGTGLTMKPSIPAVNSGSTIDVIQAPEDLDMPKASTESVFSSNQPTPAQPTGSTSEDLDDMILD